MESKSIFSSKTFWLNLAAPVFVYLSSKGLNLTPDQQMAAVAIAMSAANVAVRFFTSQAVHLAAPTVTAPKS